MQYDKGNSGNPAGRPKGSPNKATSAARKTIAAALAGADAGKLAAQLDSLTGKDYIDAYVKLAEFVTPKLQRISQPAEQEQGPTKVTVHIIGGAPLPPNTNGHEAANKLSLDVGNSRIETE